MASAIFNPPYSSHPLSISLTFLRKPTIYSQVSYSRTLTIRSLTHVGLTPFSSWNGLRKIGFSISLQSLKLEKRKKCKRRGVCASLFGVGAPEALVIGVVALLVFGPKGLADVAKNMGQTLRAFQPTIRELQEVSKEFKSTLEKEISLDELKNPVQENYTSNTVRPPSSQVPPDTLQNSDLTVTPTTTATEDSQATITTPSDSSEDLQETATIPAVSLDDSQEATITPAVTMDDSQPTDDTTNGKLYSSDDLLKITEEQLKAVASQQQKEQTSSPTPSQKPESEI